MYEIDFARGLVYQGNEGFVMNASRDGLYVVDQDKEVYLTEENSKVMEYGDGAVEAQEFSPTL